MIVWYVYHRNLYTWKDRLCIETDPWLSTGGSGFTTLINPLVPGKYYITSRYTCMTPIKYTSTEKFYHWYNKWLRNGLVL